MKKLISLFMLVALIASVAACTPGDKHQKKSEDFLKIALTCPHEAIWKAQDDAVEKLSEDLNYDAGADILAEYEKLYSEYVDAEKLPNMHLAGFATGFADIDFECYRSNAKTAVAKLEVKKAENDKVYLFSADITVNDDATVTINGELQFDDSDKINFAKINESALKNLMNAIAG